MFFSFRTRRMENAARSAGCGKSPPGSGAEGIAEKWRLSAIQPEAYGAVGLVAPRNVNEPERQTPCGGVHRGALWSKRDSVFDSRGPSSFNYRNRSDASQNSPAASALSGGEHLESRGATAGQCHAFCTRIKAKSGAPHSGSHEWTYHDGNGKRSTSPQGIPRWGKVLRFPSVGVVRSSRNVSPPRRDQPQRHSSLP